MAEEKGSLRQQSYWGAIAFGVTLAVIIGLRLDQAALAVIVGVVCGIGSGIPTSMLIVMLMRRQDMKRERRVTRQVEPEPPPSPPVVVMAPPNVPQLSQPLNWPQPATTQRQFTIIGEEGIPDGFDY